MAIILNNVEIQNIRSHKNVTFTPASDGITLISGANGSGKSSIVDSVAWTLFGTKPDGVSKNSDIIKNGTNITKEKAYALVDISIDDRRFQVQRKIMNKSGTIECDIWEIIVDEAGDIEKIHKAGPSVSHTEKYIRRTMKMDEKGFLAAIFIQQKQVDKLISAGPKERANVIEKLTGISSITLALKNSKDETNALQKAANLISANENELTELEKRKKVLSTNSEKAKNSLNNLQEKKSILVQEVRTLRNTVKIESEKMDTVEELRKEIVTVTAKIESHEETLADLINDKNDKKSKISNLASAANIQELETQLDNLRKDLRKLDYAKNELDASVKENKSVLANYNEIVNKSSVKELNVAQDSLTKHENKLQNLKNNKIDANTSISASQSEINKLSKAITVLQHGDGTCPTCLQEVNDVSSAVGILNAQKQELDSTIDDNRAKIEQYDAQIIKSESIIEKFVMLVSALSESSVIEETLKDDAKSLIKVNAEIKSAEAEIKSVEKVYNIAFQQEELNNEYKRILARAKNVSENITDMRNRKADMESEVKDSGVVTTAALERMRKKYDTEFEKYSNLSVNVSDKNGEYNLLCQELKNIDEKIVVEEENIERRKSAQKAVEVSSSTSNLISEFRENRINSSIPVIESYASNLINKFTEGKFIGLKIDAKFNTKVIVHTGVERAVGLLSGGELSVAAMSLRLAISMLLNGSSSHNLIILDEVLVSQDAVRAELILSTIKDVCKGQVVLISHNDIADSVADKIVSIKS